MALLKIARMGHPVLVRRADPVADPTAPGIRKLAEDMLDTMRDAPGVGLAAPQVHESLRMFVFRVPPGRGDGAPVPDSVLINPTIQPVGYETDLGWEGCLSIPGMRAAIRRWQRIRYTGYDLAGQAVEAEAEGFHARVIQHEYDHLDGILYPARIEDFRLFGFEEDIVRAQAPTSPAANAPPMPDNPAQETEA